MISPVANIQLTGQRHPDWEKLYASSNPETLPWHQATLDEDLAAFLVTSRIQDGRLLDLGSGSGSQAFLLADYGFSVVGSDISLSAVQKAQLKYAHPRLKFVVDNVLETRLEGKFDLIFDRGCLHVLDAGERAQYLTSIKRLLQPNGVLLLKSFAKTLQPDPGFGPLRFTEEEILEIFADHFEVEQITASEFAGTKSLKPPTHFAVIRRV